MTREEKILEVDPIVINGTAYITDSSFKKSLSEVFEYFEQQNTALQAERTNMLKTHQDTISSYQKQITKLEARIKDLEEQQDTQ